MVTWPQVAESGVNTTLELLSLCDRNKSIYWMCLVCTIWPNKFNNVDNSEETKTHKGAALILLDNKGRGRGQNPLNQLKSLKLGQATLVSCRFLAFRLLFYFTNVMFLCKLNFWTSITSMLLEMCVYFLIIYGGKIGSKNPSLHASKKQHRIQSKHKSCCSHQGRITSSEKKYSLGMTKFTIKVNVSLAINK